MSAGQQMFLGIKLELDSSGVVKGASLAGDSLDNLKNKSMSATKGVNETSNALENSLKIVGGIGAIGAASISAGNAIKENFLEPSIQQAKDFEVEMSQLRFVTGATADELARLKGVAITTGLETQFSPQEAASGIRMLKAAGLETELALESLGATLNVVTGSAGALGLQQGATATAAALLKFSHTGETAVEIMDSFAESTRQTNMQMRDLPIVLNSFRDAPAKLRLTSAEAFAMAGLMRSAGMQAAQAGQQVAMFATRFIKNQGRIDAYLRKRNITEQQLLDPDYVDKKMPRIVHAFKNLGVSLFDAQGGMKGASDVLVDLIRNAERLKGKSLKEFLVTSGQVFGARSSGMIQAMTDFKKDGKQGEGAMLALIKAIDKGKGSSREAAAAFEDTAQGMEVFIEGTKQTIAILQGEAFIPSLKLVHQVVRDILTVILNYVQANPDFAKALGMTAVLASVAATAFGMLALGFSAVFLWATMVAPAIAGIGGAAGLAALGLGALQSVMLPLLAIAGAIVLVFVALRAGIWAWGEAAEDTGFGLITTFKFIFKSIQLFWTALKTTLSGKGISDELFDELQGRGLLSILGFILSVQKQFSVLWAGVKEGVVLGMQPLIWSFLTVGHAIARVINFVASLTRFLGVQGPAVKKTLPYWFSLGKVMGAISGVILSGLIIKSIMYTVNVVPKLLWALARLAFSFVSTGIAIMRFTWTLIVNSVVAIPRALRAMGLLILSLARTAVKLAYQITLWTILNIKMVLIVAAIIAVTIAYGFALKKAWEFGEKIGPKLYEANEDILAALLGMYDLFKEGGARIGDVFVEAFKGNFDPLFDYLKAQMELVKTVLSFAIGDATVKDIDTALKGIGVTGKTVDTEKNRLQSQTILSGGDPSKVRTRADIHAGVAARVERRNRRTEAFNEELRTAQSQGKDINIGTINLDARARTPEEAARLAREMIAEINKQSDASTEEFFGQ